MIYIDKKKLVTQNQNQHKLTAEVTKLGMVVIWSADKTKPFRLGIVRMSCKVKT